MITVCCGDDRFHMAYNDICGMLLIQDLTSLYATTQHFDRNSRLSCCRSTTKPVNGRLHSFADLCFATLTILDGSLLFSVRLLSSLHPAAHLKVGILLDVQVRCVVSFVKLGGC